MAKHPWYHNSRLDSDDDDFKIVQGKKVLKDGKSYRRTGGLLMMDSNEPLTTRRAARIAADQAADSRIPFKVTDGNGQDGLSLQRPGFRMNATVDHDADQRRQQIVDARMEYESALCSAWEHPFGIRDDDGPDGAGSKGPRRREKLGAGLPAQEFKEEFDPEEDIDIATKPHRRKKRAVEVETDDSPICTITDHRSDRYLTSSAPVNRRTIADLQATREHLTTPLYDAIDERTSSAWRNPIE